MSTYKMNKDGTNYQMGASIDDVGRGDVVKVGGQLERIVRIEGQRMGTRIITESGTYTMLEINSYGKREGEKKK